MPSITYKNFRINPYRISGTIHNAGLDYIIANAGALDIAQLTTDFLVANYSVDNVSIDPVSVIGQNTAVDACDSLSDIDFGGRFNEYIQRAFDLVDILPPLLNASTKGKSYVIFGTIDVDFESKEYLLLNDILTSGLPTHQQILPLIALAVFSSSFRCWKDVYNNTGGPAASWYSYITGEIADIKDIDWRQLIQQDIKGALAGACAGVVGYIEAGLPVLEMNRDYNLCAAAGGMAASGQNLFLQVKIIKEYPR